jgi:aminopeptidase N
VIEIPEGFGSQASATAGIILDARAFRDRAELPQLYHELSHFWNPRDLDVPSPRWNEGLAMYLQYRLARELDGFAGTPAAIERARSRVCAGDARTRLERTPFLRFGAEGVTDFSYRVGFLMFSALEALLGPERLDAAIREYVQQRIARGGTTADLIAVISRASIPTPPDAFFRDWMETSAWVDPVCSAPSFAGAIARWR